MDTGTWVQILDEILSISDHANKNDLVAHTSRAEDYVYIYIYATNMQTKLYGHMSAISQTIQIIRTGRPVGIHYISLFGTLNAI